MNPRLLWILEKKCLLSGLSEKIDSDKTINSGTKKALKDVIQLLNEFEKKERSKKNIIENILRV